GHPERDRDRGRARADAELGVRALEVLADGPAADRQLAGDLVVALAAAHQAQHLRLAAREPELAQRLQRRRAHALLVEDQGAPPPSRGAKARRERMRSIATTACSLPRARPTGVQRASVPLAVRSRSPAAGARRAATRAARAVPAARPRAAPTRPRCRAGPAR